MDGYNSQSTTDNWFVLGSRTLTALLPTVINRTVPDLFGVITIALCISILERHFVHNPQFRRFYIKL